MRNGRTKEKKNRDDTLRRETSLSITHTIFKAFDCNPPLDVRSVYLDISKAFDRVWHDGLIYKLKRCNVSGQLLFLIQSFLKDRKQRTVLNGQSSNWGDISAGVPQGSILGPLFFLVYINDLAVGLKCNVKSQCAQQVMGLRIRSTICCSALHLMFNDSIFSLELLNYYDHLYKSPIFQMML